MVHVVARWLGPRKLRVLGHSEYAGGSISRGRLGGNTGEQFPLRHRAGHRHCASRIDHHHFHGQLEACGRQHCRRGDRNARRAFCRGPSNRLLSELLRCRKNAARCRCCNVSIQSDGTFGAGSHATFADAANERTDMRAQPVADGSKASAGGVRYPSQDPDFHFQSVGDDFKRSQSATDRRDNSCSVTTSEITPIAPSCATPKTQSPARSYSADDPTGAARASFSWANPLSWIGY